MNLVTLFLVLLLSLPAAASNTVAFGNSVVTVGDSTGAVRKRAGEPDRIAPVETAQGGAAGERWEYDEANKTVLLFFQHGRVVYIEEIMD